MGIFEKIAQEQHEQIVFCHDKATDLKAIIAIHNTQLGPALGGCRMYPYPSDEAALADVLRLSKAMTYKAAAANLSLGGGKAVIIGDPKKHAHEALFRAFGRFVQSFNGRYITAEDIGTNTKFIEWIYQETKYATGIPRYLGGFGDPSPFTAHGIFVGIKAALKKTTGKESLSGIKVAVQGVGHVGYCLCKELHKAGAKLYLYDTDKAALQKVAKEFDATIVKNEKDLYGLAVDVHAPCALGATINEKTIPLLKCSIIAGAANNQLALDKHATALQKAGILYAPDYVINAGGLILVSTEFRWGSREYAWERTEDIYNILLHIFNLAHREKISTLTAANRIAEHRIHNVSQTKNIYIPVHGPHEYRINQLIKSDETR